MTKPKYVKPVAQALEKTLAVSLGGCMGTGYTPGTCGLPGYKAGSCSPTGNSEGTGRACPAGAYAQSGCAGPGKNANAPEWVLP